MTTAKPGNYVPGRGEPVRFLVLHYTAGQSDTAANNVAYFRNNTVGASAHWFVDDSGWLPSVDEADTAWAVGTAGFYTQKHPVCRNGNSISIELCCKYRAGRYSISGETTANAVILTKRLMKQYGIPPENVLRHWDVVNKVCPAPWVEDETLWLDFKKRLGEELDMTKEELLATAGTGDVPSAWAKEAAEWAKENGIFTGDEGGNYGWQTPITREAVAEVLWRLEKLLSRKNA